MLSNFNKINQLNIPQRPGLYSTIVRKNFNNNIYRKSFSLCNTNSTSILPSTSFVTNLNNCNITNNTIDNSLTTGKSKSFVYINSKGTIENPCVKFKIINFFYNFYLAISFLIINKAIIYN